MGRSEGLFYATDNDQALSRYMLRASKDAEITEVGGQAGDYTAVVKVLLVKAQPARPASDAPNAVMIPAEPEKCFYLMVK